MVCAHVTAVAAIATNGARTSQWVLALRVADVAHRVVRVVRVDAEGDLVDHIGRVVRLQIVALEWLILRWDGRVVACQRDGQLLKELEEQDVCDPVLCGVCIIPNFLMLWKITHHPKCMQHLWIIFY